MPNSNKKRISTDTDKHICKYLLSSFSGSGFKSYKSNFGLSFSDQPRAISNRVDYLKNLQRNDFRKFSEIIQSYGISSGRTKLDYCPTSDYSSDSSTDTEDEDLSVAPRQSRRLVTENSKRSPKPVSFRSPKKERTTTNMPSKKPIDNHHEYLNDKFPQLSTNMTMWFRDEKVDIDGSYYSVLNIYMPLTDARDLNVIKLHLDKADPKRLYLVHPKCPTFMYRDFKAMHSFEEDGEYPDIYATSKMNHKHFAFDIKKKEHMKLAITEYELPFALSNMKLGRIDHHGSEIMKHYRKVDCLVKDGITQECKFVFWKILIDEERSDDADENIAEDAFNWMEDRMSKMKMEN